MLCTRVVFHRWALLILLSLGVSAGAQPQTEIIADWSTYDAAIAISAKRGEIGFNSSGVMISPRIGLASAHALEDIDSGMIHLNSRSFPKANGNKMLAWQPHPDYTGNNFDGVDLGVFVLEEALELNSYFVPTSIFFDDLMKAPFLRLGYGGLRFPSFNVEMSKSGSALRTRKGEHYLSSPDRNGFPGDSGGPVFVTSKGTNHLIGIHFGSETRGEPLYTYSDTLILNPKLMGWVADESKKWGFEIREGLEVKSICDLML